METSMPETEIGDAASRRKLTGRGLYWALGVVLLSMNLIASAVVVAIGPSEHRAGGLVLGGICALLLAGYAWRRPDLAPAEPPPVKEPSQREYAITEGLLAGILLVQFVLFVLASGPDRMRLVFPAGLCAFAIFKLERRRRSRGPGPGP
jgi:threonine/homoserine/homoserine lactone efflux protein